MRITTGWTSLTIAAAGLAIAGTLGTMTPAAGQATPAIVRLPRLEAALEPGKLVASVHSVEIDFAPSQATGLHLHPIPVVGEVTSGAIRFQPEGQPSRILKTGEAFYEPANIKILLFNNVSDRLPASIVAFYLLGPDDHQLITMLESP